MDLTKIIVNLRRVVGQLDDMIHLLERTAASKSKRIARTVYEQGDKLLGFRNRKNQAFRGTPLSVPGEGGYRSSLSGGCYAGE
jgi:hypothetical protein